MFTRLYASGTRTVRGLEALSLSVPPTPGESIVKRAGNTGLFCLAEVFNAKGYDSEFLYGGYGAFDDMNAFFAGNGYGVHDRTEIADKDIHHANVWGVADEDLYTLALSRFDRAHAAAQAVLRAPDDDVEPSSVHVPGRTRSVAAEATHQRGAVHRLGDRRFPGARAQARVVRGHGVRLHRRPLRDERRQGGAAGVPLSHSVVGVRAGACRAGARSMA